MEGAGAARPARIRAVSLRQHGGRRSLQRLDRSDTGWRMANDGLEQRLGNDRVRHAGRVHAWHLRHMVSQLPDVHCVTAFGMPGVFTHGTFDTWSPSYLMFIAAMHNGISRLYETFGNGGAD